MSTRDDLDKTRGLHMGSGGPLLFLLFKAGHLLELGALEHDVDVPVVVPDLGGAGFRSKHLLQLLLVGSHSELGVSGTLVPWGEKGPHRPGVIKGRGEVAA